MLSSEYLTAEEEEERLERARRAVEEKLEEKLEDKPTTRLWGLFRDARDIAERHVISKLNETDVKFFYDVNSETRELIKRATATRSGMKLAEKFKIEEMSSISTLEFALENRSLWLSEWDEKYFCAQVARTNKLELLQWIREEKKCAWDEETSAVAARQGNLEMVKYCVANRCPIDAFSCRNAARNGHLECLKYLHEEAKTPWDWKTASRAAENGHLHILEYLVEREYDEYNEFACGYAAENGHLDCLKYLHEVAKAPWDSRTAFWAAENGHLHILEYLVEREYDEYNENACLTAALNGHLDCLKYLHEEAKAPWNGAAVRSVHRYNHPDCLQYLLDNDCPLPEGWRYERGELYPLYSSDSESESDSESSST